MGDSEEIPQQGRSGSDAPAAPKGTVGRLRAGSVSAANKLLDYNPARGMWPAFGMAVAHVPNITDLRSPGDVTFDSHGHSAKEVTAEELRDERLARSNTFASTDLKGKKDPEKKARESEANASSNTSAAENDDINDVSSIQPKVPWGIAIKKGFVAAGKFIFTPTGFFIVLYGLNVVAWGAMLFFLLLGASPWTKLKRKQWIEIDSQVLNGLFCLTAWGLAPWRFRDLYWLSVWRLTSGHSSKESIRRLAERNQSWYRRRHMDLTDDDENLAHFDHQQTLTGEVAPPTATWKMDFVVCLIVMNSLLQCGMAAFMWCYNRHNRPSWGVALFIGLGCLCSLLAGVMCWWEGRKIKIIEGPKIKPKEETA